MKKKRLCPLICTVVFSAVLITLSCTATGKSTKYVKTGHNIATQKFEPFIRIDGDSPVGYKEPLKNVRYITGGHYSFKAPAAKYKLDASYKPNEAGLSTLDISGSYQFSEEQCKKMIKEIKALAPDKEIYVFDLRREYHVLLDGISFSYYGNHNHTNIGKSSQEIEVGEVEFFKSYIGKTLKAYTKKQNKKNIEVTFYPTSLMTERELVERQGCRYVRIPVLDHSWPTPEEIDAFIEFVKSIDMNKVWLHFHCHAGKGRTGIYMMMYDKMKNPQLPLNDIVMRHVYMGASYPFYQPERNSYRDEVAHFYAEKAAMLPLFFQYADETRKNNYTPTWSEWLKGRL